MFAATLLFAAVLQSGKTSDSILNSLSVRNIGPAVISGRITDLAVYEQDPKIIYIASASGGVWKTTNGGITMAPIFDSQPVESIGSVAVSQGNPNDIWVGTGEATARNSVGWGDGVYRSRDGGQTWQHLGLPHSYQISRIVLDPKASDTAYVAACGPVWTTGGDRGVYKTTDGGRSWRRVLFVDDRTAAADLAIDPKDGKILLVGMWQVQRKPYDFHSGGPGSGLYRSTDSGETWQKVINGLAPGPYGRIGVSFMRNDPRICIATVQFAAPKSEKRETMVEDGGVYRSTNGGASWKFVSRLNPRPFYFSRPLADPSKPNIVYIPGWRLYVSKDAGKTFDFLGNDSGSYLKREGNWLPYHDDVHVAWVDPKNSNHLVFGTDGGVYQSYDGGKTLEHFDNLPVAQFYSVAYDNRDPYWVYGGTQDSYSWAIPTYNDRGYTVGADAYRYTHGDGFHIAVDPSDWQNLYVETQLGQIQRVDQSTGESTDIRPEPLGDTGKYRFNWNTPFALSPSAPHTIYVGTNHLMRSTDRGDHWSEISPDLTTNDSSKLKSGEDSVTEDFPPTETHCTIVTLAESPLTKGEIWTGSDDGQLQLTRDGGATWANLTPKILGLPANTWCSCVLPSKHEPGRAYVLFDGHREADFRPYLFVTEDFGATWQSLSQNLPGDVSLYTLCEDVENPNLLFVGSERGLSLSWDRGASWHSFKGIPAVETFDLQIQPRERDLIVGTHGRGVWLMDIWNLEQLNADVESKDVALLNPKPIRLRAWKGASDFSGNRGWRAANAPIGTDIGFWMKGSAKVDLDISETGGKRSRKIEVDAKDGYNSVHWDGKMSDRERLAGTYTISVRVGEKECHTSVQISADYQTGVRK